jgi:hypothetical protein
LFLRVTQFSSIALAACSWLSVPGVHTRGEYRDDAVAAKCTASYSSPDLDAVVSGLATLVVISSLVQLSSDVDDTKDPVGPFYDYVGAGIGGLFLLPYSLSAFHGFRHVGRCRAELRKPPHP